MSTTVELVVTRFDPERDEAPRNETYEVPLEPMDRVLDLLIRAKERFDAPATDCGVTRLAP